MAAKKPVTKKLINSPESCVDDNLRGIVAIYPTLHLHPKHRVITVTRKNDSGRVAVLGGGGSGHEPFAGGFIGAGMLDGAVAGGVFASPPTGHVLYGITHLFKYNSGGVLVILGNYTGDRLNFGKAIEKAKIAGIKLCGAMSAKGYDLETMREMAAEANKYMATLGVCLSACSLPGQPPLFEIAHDEMELGAGVHGEAGIEKMKMGSAKDVVQMILDKVTSHLKLAAGDRVAVMIDNLGGTSFMEMNIISAETKDYLENKKIKVERIYSGSLKTSLEMHGFQICLLHLNKEHGDLWLEFLDDPTSAIGWTGGLASVRGERGYGDDDTLLDANQKKLTTGPVLTVREQDILRGSLVSAAEELVMSEELLNRLDSGCGDGDCGNTLKKFAQAVLTYLKTASLEYPSSVLWDLSEFAETDMGGTSGGIYSLGLSAASQTVAGGKTNDVSLWLAAWESAITAISKYGGAEPGDRTMLDTLHQSAEAFKQNLNKDLNVLLKNTVEAAESGAKATAKMTARAGRASYVASGYTQDEDAGARAAAIWLRAILDHIANKY